MTDLQTNIAVLDSQTDAKAQEVTASASPVVAKKIITGINLLMQLLTRLENGDIILPPIYEVRRVCVCVCVCVLIYV
jgi:hypothetical protein